MTFSRPVTVQESFYVDAAPLSNTQMELLSLLEPFTVLKEPLAKVNEAASAMLVMS